MDFVFDCGPSEGPRRFSVGPGYNVLVPAGSSSFDIFSEAILFLLFPATYRPSHLLNSVCTRLAVTAVEGSESYRIIAGTAGDSIGLARQSAGDEGFSTVATDPAAVQEILSKWLGVDLYTYSVLFLMNLLPPPLSSLSVSEAASELAAVEDQIERSAKIAALEAMQVEKNGELFKLEDTAAKLNALEEAVRTAEESYKQFASFEGEGIAIPENIEKAVDSYERMLDEHAERMLEMDRRIEDLIKKALDAVPTPLQNRPLFWGLVGGTFASLVGGLLYEPLRLLLLGIATACIGGTAALTVKYIFDKEKASKLQESVNAVENEKRREEKRVSLEGASIRALMNKYGVEHPKDLVFLEKDRKKAKAEFDKASAELEAFKRNVKPEELRNRIASLKSELAAIDRELAKLSEQGFSDDINRLRERSLELRRTLFFYRGMPAEVIGRAASVLGKSSDEIFALINSALCANVKNVSRGKFNSVIFKDGKIGLAVSGGSVVSFDDLSGDDLLSVKFAVHFTVLQLIARVKGLPLVVLGPVADNTALSSAAVGFLSYLSDKSGVQVIHLCSASSARTKAETAIEFGLS